MTLRACLRPAGRLVRRLGADPVVAFRRGLPCVARPELERNRAPRREREPFRWVEPFRVVWSPPVVAAVGAL